MPAESTSNSAAPSNCMRDKMCVTTLVLPPFRFVFVISRDRYLPAVLDNIKDAARGSLRHILRQQRNLRAWCESHFAAVRFHIATQDPHERRLAGAVAPSKPIRCPESI